LIWLQARKNPPLPWCDRVKLAPEFFTQRDEMPLDEWIQRGSQLRAERVHHDAMFVGFNFHVGPFAGGFNAAAFIAEVLGENVPGNGDVSGNGDDPAGDQVARAA